MTNYSNTQGSHYLPRVLTHKAHAAY